jgi:hypothetical protein
MAARRFAHIVTTSKFMDMKTMLSGRQPSQTGVDFEPRRGIG